MCRFDALFKAATEKDDPLTGERVPDPAKATLSRKQLHDSIAEWATVRVATEDSVKDVNVAKTVPDKRVSGFA